MVVLVNRHSASASEIVAACLQDHARAVVIGERTWGKGSVQNIIELENGRSALKLTTAGYFRPSGKNIDRFEGAGEEDDWGVHPNDGYRLALTPDEMRQLLERQRDWTSWPIAGSRAKRRAMRSTGNCGWRWITLVSSWPDGSDGNPMKLLILESTCDETAAAVVSDSLEVLGSAVASQDELHRRFQGVVPEIAARAHVERILPVIDLRFNERKSICGKSTPSPLPTRRGWPGPCWWAWSLPRRSAWRWTFR